MIVIRYISKYELQLLLYFVNFLLQYEQLYPDKPDSSTELIQTVRQPVESDDPSSTAANDDNSENAYNLGVIKQVQVIFAHLSHSQLQFYVPKGFWKQFRWVYVYIVT